MDRTFRFWLTAVDDVDALGRVFYEHFEGLVSHTSGLTTAEIEVEVPEATNLRELCIRTISRLEALLGVTVEEVALDLVDIPEIAERVSRTRQNVQQLVTGVRGAGGFPPALGSPGGIRIWDWTSVANWLMASGVDGVYDLGLPRADLFAVNAWLEQRRAADSLSVAASSTS